MSFEANYKKQILDGLGESCQGQWLRSFLLEIVPIFQKIVQGYKNYLCETPDINTLSQRIESYITYY